MANMAAADLPDIAAKHAKYAQNPSPHFSQMMNRYMSCTGATCCAPTRRFRLKDSQDSQNPMYESDESCEICESYQPIRIRQTHPDATDDIKCRKIHVTTLTTSATQK